MPDKCCPEKVEFLITNQNTAFTEEDREFLEGLSDIQIEKVVVSVNQVPAANQEPKKPETLDEVLTIAPAGIQQQIKDGLAQLASHREVMVNKIVANARNTFSKEVLEQMPLDFLQAITAMATPATNYAPASPAAPVVNESKIPEPYVAPVFSFTK